MTGEKSGRSKGKVSERKARQRSSSSQGEKTSKRLKSPEQRSSRQRTSPSREPRKPLEASARATSHRRTSDSPAVRQQAEDRRGDLQARETSREGDRQGGAQSRSNATDQPRAKPLHRDSSREEGNRHDDLDHSNVRRSADRDEHGHARPETSANGKPDLVASSRKHLSQSAAQISKSALPERRQTPKAELNLLSPEENTPPGPSAGKSKFTRR